MPNEAIVSVAGYIATDPDNVKSKSGTAAMTKMRLAWTPRRFDRETNSWVDQPTCFVWVKCWRKLAENAYFSLSKGDPVVVSGTLTVSEYLAKDGTRRLSVDITATAIGHDLTRGVTSIHRQRSSSDQASQDARSSETESAEAGSDRLEALESGADTDSREFDTAEAGPGDLAIADDEARDLEAGGLDPAGPAQARSPLDANVADEADEADEETLEPAPAR
jgi:single-strand DNA-binding protein